jgi:hypothetical protein
LQEVFDDRLRKNDQENVAANFFVVRNAPDRGGILKICPRSRPDGKLLIFLCLPKPEQ